MTISYRVATERHDSLAIAPQGEKMKEVDWSVSGLCVTTRREDLTSVTGLLNARPGVEVRASDPQSGRLVVVQEGSSVEDHQDKLREIQALPGVLTADLVVHYQDLDDFQQPRATGGA